MSIQPGPDTYGGPPFLTVKGDPGGGRGEHVSRDVVDVATFIVHRFKVNITAGYDPFSGDHVSAEHNDWGTAIDIVPDFSRGGTWDDVQDAAAWANDQGWDVYFDATLVPGTDDPTGTHGRPDKGEGGTHAHLDLEPVDDPRKLGVTPITTGSAALGAAQDAAGTVGNAALDIAKAVISTLFDLIGENGARILLYVALVIGGAVLGLVGLARMFGIKGASLRGAPA